MMQCEKCSMVSERLVWELNEKGIFFMSLSISYYSEVMT